MSRADELREQLAAVEAEESALSALEETRARFRANPDDPDAKAAAQAAAVAVREVRVEQRPGRAVTPARPGAAVVSPATVAAAAAVQEV